MLYRVLDENLHEHRGHRYAFLHAFVRHVHGKDELRPEVLTLHTDVIVNEAQLLFQRNAALSRKVEVGPYQLCQLHKFSRILFPGVDNAVVEHIEDEVRRDPVTRVHKLQLHKPHLHLQLTLAVVRRDEQEYEREDDKKRDNRIKPVFRIAHVGILFLHLYLVVELQGVLRIAHHYLRCPHPHGVMFQRIVVPSVLHQTFVCLLVIAGFYIIVEHVTVPDVHEVEVIDIVRRFLIKYPPDFRHIVMPQSQPYAYGMAVVKDCRVILGLKELFCDIKVGVGLLFHSEVQIDVGHVEPAQEHVVALAHLVFQEKSFITPEHFQSLCIVTFIIIEIAVVVEKVELHVQRQQTEVALRLLVTPVGGAVVFEARVYASETGVQAHVVLGGQLQRVGKIQRPPVPVSRHGHVAHLHVCVAEVCAHVGQPFLHVAAEEHVVGRAVNVGRKVWVVVELVVIRPFHVVQIAQHALYPRGALPG